MNSGTLGLENLSRTVELDAGGPVASDLRVEREMRSQGLRIPTDDQAPGGSATGSVSFGNLFEKAIGQVNQHQAQADLAIRELVAGRTKNIHETMLAIERADTSLKLMMQVRNKVLDAYREIMRMQV